MLAGATSRLLLRAEVRHEGRTVVSHTLGLDPGEAFVPLDAPPPIGARVELRLSFPRLVEPVVIDGVVTAHRASTGPGDPAGAVIALRVASAADRARLAQLLSAAPDAAADAVPGYRVLLVEDNALISDLFAYGVRKYFRERRSGLVLDLARDGAEALAKLQAAGCDLAIVDVYLPVLGGAELIARMRRDPALAGVAVVAISVGGADAREASLAAGADIFLHKPLVMRDLFATLEWLTSQRSAP
ncbi:MAG TPA: response regulator [Polyangia bacterium]|jgi:CheY-like chemotaxis protein